MKSWPQQSALYAADALLLVAPPTSIGSHFPPSNKQTGRLSSDTPSSKSIYHADISASGTYATFRQRCHLALAQVV